MWNRAEAMAKFETEIGARALLDKIQTYWAERGYRVEGYVFAGDYCERLRSTVFEVRTDMVNGRPITRSKAA